MMHLGGFFMNTWRVPSASQVSQLNPNAKECVPQKMMVSTAKVKYVTLTMGT